MREKGKGDDNIKTAYLSYEEQKKTPKNPKNKIGRRARSQFPPQKMTQKRRREHPATATRRTRGGQPWEKLASLTAAGEEEGALVVGATDDVVGAAEGAEVGTGVVGKDVGVVGEPVLGGAVLGEEVLGEAVGVWVVGVLVGDKEGAGVVGEKVVGDAEGAVVVGFFDGRVM